MLTKAAVAIASAACLLSPVHALNSTNSSDLVRALRPAADPNNCCNFIQDIDLPNADIGSVQERDKTQCCLHCKNNRACQAATWTNNNGGTCWLKSLTVEGVVRKGALSLLTSCQSPFVMLHNCDIPGNDFRQVGPRDSFHHCFSPCMAIPSCVAFTWSDYLGGTCFLKNAISPCVGASNKHSGAVGLTVGFHG